MEIGTIISGLLGGLALFLYGLEQMTSSLNRAAGKRMQFILAAATASPFRGLLTGAGVTALVQSSSLTTVLCVGFISAGLMTLRQAVGVIVGANIGTTVTAQLVAFDVQAVALPLLTLGVAIRFLSSGKWHKHVGTVLLGIGLLFYGMELMSQSTEPLRNYEPFIEFMKSLDQAWLGIVVGAAFTALIQSSSATTGLVIVLGAQNLLSLEAAISLVLGANVGSCATAALAAWGREAAARQAAAVHIIFNIAGAACWWVFLTPLAHLTIWLSGPDVARQIANAHTVFNTSSALVFLGLSSSVANFVERLIPAEEEKENGVEPHFLDQTVVSVPALALERVRLELRHLGHKAIATLEGALQPERSTELAQQISPLHDAIINYMRLLIREDMTQAEAKQFEASLVIADSLESVAVVVKDLAAYESELVGRPFLPDLASLHRLVTECLAQSVEALDRPELAQTVRDRKGEVRDARDIAMRKAMEHLGSERPGVAPRFRQRTGEVDELRHAFYLASRIAKAVQAAEFQMGPGQGSESGAAESEEEPVTRQ